MNLAEILEKNGDLFYVDGLLQKRQRAIIIRIRAYINTLDEIPFVTSVYKKHLNIKKYFSLQDNFPMVMIMTGRGCLPSVFSVFIHKHSTAWL